MSARPLVSMIINNFNYARFLRDAIDSALAQTWPNLEVDREKRPTGNLVVVGWPAFWWMEYYRSAAGWLERHADLILHNDRIRIYRLPVYSSG